MLEGEEVSVIVLEYGISSSFLLPPFSLPLSPLSSPTLPTLTTLREIINGVISNGSVA